ncbi:MAG: phage portal protein [Clostridia bacterium]|nr:phage portal protein [Clostridia bacterium]
MFNFDSPVPVGRLAVDGVVTDKEFIEREIRNFKASRSRKEMLDGERYFDGRHDILKKKRTAIGSNGELMALTNLPNNRVVDNQYRKLVNQKANYLLGRPITLRTENKEYAARLQEIFNARTMRMWKNTAKAALNQGLAWILLCYDEQGNFTLRRIPAHELRPGWRDAEHTMLDYAIRIYPVISYSGREEEMIEKVEVYDGDGIYFFVMDGDSIKPEEPFYQPYFFVGDVPANWTRIPLIAFKRDADETPLIRNVKCLQDGLNAIISTFQNNMEEDTRNTILILKNYDGEKLDDFRRNLAAYGAVKVRTIDGAPGGIETLRIEVNAENYKTILEIFKKAITENAMGYDAKDDRMAGNPNQMNIQSMYSDIDLDANDMEMEFQAAFEELLWFVNCHLANTGRGDFEGEAVEIIFNRDVLINEGDVINNIVRSEGLLSTETLIANHPWVDDPAKEIARLKKQQKAQLDEMYEGAFRRKADPEGGGE